MHPFPAGMLAQGLAGGGGVRPQDVFAILTQPANQMQAAINALPFAPDLIFDKDRVAAGDWSWRSRGRSNFATTLASNTTAAEASWPGYSGSNNRVAYALQKRAKVYDEVTWTGDGTPGRQVPHNLGIAPGMLVTKQRTASSGWIAIHRSIISPNANWYRNYLNLAATGPAGDWGDDTAYAANPTAASFSVGTYLNEAGQTYVAGLFAHDPDPNGIIQCETFTTNGGGGATVSLGWKPQFAIIKRLNDVGNWIIVDTVRGWSAGQPDLQLAANASAAEVTGNDIGSSDSTGFTFVGGPNSPYVYLAIRAPV